MTSNARIPLERWTHITLMRTKDSMKLYVNGILDVVQKFNGTTLTNKDPLYFGSVPWHHDDCQVPLYMDEVRLYNDTIPESLLEAEASPALGGIEVSFI